MEYSGAYAIHGAALNRPRSGTDAKARCHGRAGSKNDLRDGAEFRCGAAKAFYYISFRDKSALGSASQRRVERCPTQDRRALRRLPE
ncbi:hypothetical protein [Burkholderia sp. WP9]|uniref:hypothetical protein n=1 Tax=Burkholderia sp. WP9 TaxID=1500263 RepID=UPI00115FB1EC|nr:hypothetical protein [Burkholderia sp. WP9]